MERWLTLHNPSTAQGHWYLHQLLFLPRAAPEHHRQSPYHTQPQRLGAQSFLQPAQPALPLGQGPDALQQGPPLDTTPTEQRRGSSNADGAEPDRTNCGVVAWTAACRHLARDFAGIRQYRPADRTALASTVAAVTMGPVAAWPARLIPHAPAKIRGPANRPQRTRQRHPSRRNNCTSSQQRYWRTAGGSFVHHHGPTQIAGSIQGPQRNAPHSWHGILRECTRVRDAGGGTPQSPAGGTTGAAGGGLPGHPARPRQRVPVTHPSRGLLDHLARHRQTGGIPAPC